MNDEPELEMSPLCQDVEREGITVRVEIYGTGKKDWILEVVNEAGDSIVWNDTFETDRSAFDEFLRTLEAEGIRSF